MILCELRQPLQYVIWSLCVIGGRAMRVPTHGIMLFSSSCINGRAELAPTVCSCNLHRKARTAKGSPYSMSFGVYA